MRTLNLDDLIKSISILPDANNYEQGHIYILNVPVNNIPLKNVYIDYTELNFICRYIYQKNKKVWELIIDNEVIN